MERPSLSDRLDVMHLHYSAICDNIYEESDFEIRRKEDFTYGVLSDGPENVVFLPYNPTKAELSGIMAPIPDAGVVFYKDTSVTSSGDYTPKATFRSARRPSSLRGTSGKEYSTLSAYDTEKLRRGIVLTASQQHVLAVSKSSLLTFFADGESSLNMEFKTFRFKPYESRYHEGSKAQDVGITTYLSRKNKWWSYYYTIGRSPSSVKNALNSIMPLERKEFLD